MVNTRAKQEFERYMNLLYICDDRETGGRESEDKDRKKKETDSRQKGVWLGWNE